MRIGDLTITSLETFTAFDIVTGAFKWVLDELQNATIANTQETTDITGKQGRLLNSLKRNKAVTVSGTNGLISAGLLETQVGSDFENKKTSVMYPDYVVVTGGEATTTYKATGTLGSEIAGINIRNADGTLGKEFTQGSAVSSGVFTYDPATKTLEFADGDIEDGTEIAVYYKREIQANVLKNMSDKYSEKVSLYVDAFAEDKCSNVFHIQIHIPKADVNGNFDLAMGDAQTVHAFEARALAGACGNSGEFWTYTVFGVDTPDAA